MVKGMNRDKPLKKLAQGVWQAKVQKYEDMWGSKRAFPQEMIVGAEDILARLVWENEVSNICAPLKLCEILQARSYEASGEVNRCRHTSTARDIFQMRYDEGDHVQFEKQDREYNPWSEEKIKEALDANKWACAARQG